MASAGKIIIGSVLAAGTGLTLYLVSRQAAKPPSGAQWTKLAQASAQVSPLAIATWQKLDSQNAQVAVSPVAAWQKLAITNTAVSVLPLAGWQKLATKNINEALFAGVLFSGSLDSAGAHITFKNVGYDASLRPNVSNDRPANYFTVGVAAPVTLLKGINEGAYGNYGPGVYNIGIAQFPSGQASDVRIPAIGSSKSIVLPWITELYLGRGNWTMAWLVANGYIPGNWATSINSASLSVVWEYSPDGSTWYNPVRSPKSNLSLTIYRV